MTAAKRPSAKSASAPKEAAAPRLPTAFVTGSAMLDHLTPAGFPERPERLVAALELIEALITEGTLPAERLLRLPSRAATDDELAAAHDPEYIARIHRAVDALAPRDVDDGPFQATPIRRFTTDVYLSPGTGVAAAHAAGGALVALDAIAGGRARNGYALVRPPGHHASRDAAMGFCVFNNVAVAARYAQRRHGWTRVLIVDFDVHHGNGTQDIFYDDPTVTYFSTHQYPWYPGSGAADERGDGAGAGATINVPLPAGSGWSVYDPIFRQVLWPVADRFKPDVVLVSAGFDAHFREDPGLGEMRLSTPDFSDLMLEVTEIADRYCEGRLVAIQEGGYNLTALSQCAATLLVALTGSDGIVDTLGQPEPLRFRWNEEAIIQALYELHELAGYRRKARRPITMPQPPASADPAPQEP
ncbi:MAG TPA: histone deacetylase [Ktedonobacterales bacterium]|nr:histone deacetylase [Ktedonobacterales bacterium]